MAPQFAEAPLAEPGLEDVIPSANIVKEGTMAPETEKHHEQPEKTENLGASQTGAETEATKVSAESEQEKQKGHAPSSKQQVPRPAAPPRQTTPHKRTSSEAATKQAEKDKKKQKPLPPKQSTLQLTPQKTTSAKTTVLSESLSEFKTSLLDFKHGLTGALRRCSQQKGGASALTKLIAGTKAAAATSSASAPPKQDSTASLHVSVAAQQAKVTLPSEEDGFIPRRTASGNSYGSLEPYVDTWNDSDLAEVSSNPQPHPAGPSATARRLFEVGVLADRLSRGAHLATEAAKVTLYFGLFCFGKTYASPQSPRFGLNKQYLS